MLGLMACSSSQHVLLKSAMEAGQLIVPFSAFAYVEVFRNHLANYTRSFRTLWDFLHFNPTTVSLSIFGWLGSVDSQKFNSCGFGLAPPTLIVSRILIASNFFQLHTTTY